MPLRDGDELDAARPHAARSLHRPGHSPSDTVFLDERRADPDRRRSPAGAHLLQPAHVPAAGRRAGRRTSGRAAPRAARLHRVAARDARAAGASSCCGGHGPPVTDHVALIDERLRMHDAAGAQDAPAARARAADRVRAGGRDVGQRRRHAGVPDDLGGARPPRSARSPKGAVGEDSAGPVTKFIARLILQAGSVSASTR